MHLSYYTYPWDLLDGGIAESLRYLKEQAGADSIDYAAVYHTGKFILPHNPRRRVHFNEGAAVYYRPSPQHYGRLKPVVSHLVGEHGDPLERTCEAAQKLGVKVVGWTVCLHNTALASQHPECAITNAYGEAMINALCPGHPDSQEYLLGIAADLAGRYPLARLDLESPDFMGFWHGYHHEIIGVRITRYLEFLLGLCFCAGCTATARAAGIDVEGLRAWVRSELETAMAEDLPVPAEDPTGADVTEALIRRDDLRGFVALRIRTVRDLVARIREVARSGGHGTTVAVFGGPHGSWRGGGALQDLAPVADAVILGYPVTPDDARYLVGKVRQKVPGTSLIGSIRAIDPQTRSSEDVVALLRAYQDLGVEQINIYNYGLCKASTLGRIGACKDGL